MRKAKSITFRVTRKDITNGVRKHPSNCPAALALKRARPNKEVHVDELAVVIGDLRYCMCQKLRAFVFRFDNRKRVQPGVYTIELNAAS